MNYTITKTQDITSTADLSAILAPMIGSLIVTMIIAYIISVIPMWKQFTKAGEAGWKSLIPIYNSYLAFKLFYKAKMFWALLIVSFVSGLLAAIPVIGWLVAIADAIFSLVVAIKFVASKAKSFGKGTGFAVGLFFLTIIFDYILAFGGSEYKQLEENK